jgi:plastocyanin
MRPFSTLVSLCAALAAAAMVAPSAARAQSIEGTVDFTGTPPVPRQLSREADPVCAKKKMTDETVLVAGGKLANVWVHVIAGAPDSPPATEAAPVEVDQTDCMYRPRVQPALVGQKIVIKNSDPTMHNVHTYFGTATLSNKVMMNEKVKPLDSVADQAGVYRWKCDMHPWMRGFLGVNKNPFQAVTGADGKFKLEGLKPGKYTVEAWHEKFGVKTLEVTVAAGKAAVTTFKFDGTEQAN